MDVLIERHDFRLSIDWSALLLLLDNVDKVVIFNNDDQCGLLLSLHRPSSLGTRGNKESSSRYPLDNSRIPS